jgi:thiamine biosynthesis lipoprotein
MPARRLSRRRILTILAAAGGSLLAGGHARPRADFAWRGVAMGADAEILFSGIEEEAARRTIAVVVAEIDRLENALSLFREDSEICRLNRAGVLSMPSGDLRRALALGLEVAAASGGLFDPTVQALWEAHADWFSAGQDRMVPGQVVADARRMVDWHRVELAADMIRLGSGQRITLNGLGQGYVTDRVADLLRARGLKHILVDLGEQRALGPRVGGAPWQIARPGGEPIALTSGALATSEGEGCILGAGGAAHHLFDPRTGRSALRWRRIIVHHRSAAVADALSTALYAASCDEIQAIAARFGGVIVWGTDAAGREHRWSAPSIDGKA